MSTWDQMYEGTPPWDIGRPQPAFVDLVERGIIKHNPILDVGCGTGENALHFAAKGLEVVGIDSAPRAIAKAQGKAKERNLKATFLFHDALDLASLHRQFATVTDCGLFHTFDAAERPAYVASLASVADHDARLYVLCFSDEGPDTGPHPVSQEELRAAFNPGNEWKIAAIEPGFYRIRRIA